MSVAVPYSPLKSANSGCLTIGLFSRMYPIIALSEYTISAHPDLLSLYIMYADMSSNRYPMTAVRCVYKLIICHHNGMSSIAMSSPK